MGSNYILWIWSENLAPQNFCSAQSPRAGHFFSTPSPKSPSSPAKPEGPCAWSIQGLVSSDQFFLTKVNYDIICAGLACFVSSREKAGCLLIDRLPSRCRPAEGLEKPNTLRCNFTSRQPFLAQALLLLLWAAVSKTVSSQHCCEYSTILTCINTGYSKAWLQHSCIWAAHSSP